MVHGWPTLQLRGEQRRNRVFAALALVAFATAGCTSRSILMPNLQGGARTATYQQDHEVFHLSTNGLTVLLLPTQNTNLVKVDVRYPAGALEDFRGKSGLAHLIEHVTFSTRHQEPEGATLAELLSRSALWYNGYTTAEETHYSSVALADQVDTLLEVESYRMRSRCELIDERDLARARDVVRNEIRQGIGVGSEMAQMFRRAVYGKTHPYARPVGGTDRSIASIERDDVCRFLRDHYGPSAAILAVSGNIDKKQVQRAIVARFGRIEKQPAGQRSSMARLSLRGTTSRHELPVEQATAVVAFQSPRLLDRDALIARFAREMLRQSLYSLLREHPFIVDINTGVVGASDAPLHYITVSVNAPARLEKAVALIYKEAASVGKGLSQPAFDDMRNRTRTALLSRVESFDDQADVFIEYLSAGDNGQFLLRDLAAVAGLARGDVQTYALHYLERESSHVAYFYPKKAAKIVEERAALRAEHTDYRMPDRHMVIDRQEAERPLQVSERRPQTKFEHFALDNGLQVYLAPSLSYPVVDLRVVFPAGRAHEPADKPGLAELTAMLMEPEFHVSDFEAPTLMGAFTIGQIMQMGGDYDWDVDDLATSFRMRGLSIYGDGLLWRLYFMLSSASYEKSSLRELRELVQRREKARDTQPSWPRLVMETLFGKDYRLGIRRPDSASLASLSVGDLEDFRELHYRPAGAAIIVTGRFDAEYMAAEVRRLFGAWKGTSGPKAQPVLQPVQNQKAAYFAAIDEDEIQTNIIMAFRTEPDDLKQAATRLVMSEIVRDKLGILRNQLGATYGIKVDHTPLRSTGILAIEVAVDRERAGEAFVAMRKALDQIRAGEFTDEFVRARRLVMQRLLAATVNSRTVADQLTHRAMRGLGDSHYDQLVQTVAELQPRDVRALSDRELAARREVVVAQGRKESVDALYRAAHIAQYRVVE
ncbi:MAG: insulinase family protein [Proteobacteria bacterium]|nr:insulinase family protein [Pseudomonadota bacterium]